MPPDRRITLALVQAHGLRHDYFRNMAGLDEKKPRGDHEGWVLLGNESWLRHSERGVIIAATGAKWLVENGMSISAAAMLPPDALALELPSAQKLLSGVSSIATCPPHMRVRVLLCDPRGSAAQICRISVESSLFCMHYCFPPLPPHAVARVFKTLVTLIVSLCYIGAPATRLVPHRETGLGGAACGADRQ